MSIHNSEQPISSPPKTPKVLPWWLHFLPGTASGMALVTVAYPVDTIITWLQSPASPYKTFGAMWQAAKSMGPFRFTRTLYRGLSIPLSTVGVSNALLMGVYGNMKDNITKWDADNGHELHPLVISAVAGGTAGFTQSFLSTPAEVLRVNMQVQEIKADTSSGLLSVARDLRKQLGVLAFYRGFGLTALRDIIGRGTLFTTYEFIKGKISKPNQSPSLVISTVAGGCAGAAFWSVIYPIHTLKIRFQTVSAKNASRTTWQCMQLAHKQGLSSLFKGYGLALVRTFPLGAIQFGVYESVHKWIS